jgi:hypothetical protein
MANKQPTPQELALMQAEQNKRFMELTYEQWAQALAQNGTVFGAGQQIQFDAPITQGGYAVRVVLEYDVDVKVTKGTGTAVPNAAFPYSLVENLSVTFGNKQVNIYPYFSKVLDQLEGYNRGPQFQSFGQKSSAISSMIDTVPTTFVEGSNKVKFTASLDLNNIHPQSINGILPIFASGTKMQLSAQCASSVTGSDPLLHPIKTTGNAAVEVTGNIRAYVVYRDWQSMTTLESLQPSLSGLPTVQAIQLPSAINIGAGVYNPIDIKNPYPFVKVLSLVIDGNQSDKFSVATNVTGLRIEKAQNTSSAFKVYSDENGGMANYYREIRQVYGQDLDEGVLVPLDATTENVSNVSSKGGTAWLNMTGAGYPAGRLMVRPGTTATTNGITPRVVSCGIILNSAGIQVN